METDVLIIGSGIAGLFTANLLSDKKNVILITKNNIDNSNSILAQGGIAAAIDDNDNWEDHFKDTIIAGKNHNLEETTKQLVKGANEAIKQLIDLGIPFDRNEDNQLELGREGGHHKRRIVHAGGDATGKEIIKSLINHVKQNITIHQRVMAYDLIIENGKCVGTVAKNDLDQLIIYKAKHTILATGGIGRLYTVTSNDPTITGDGIAMAYRAGADLADLEFIQFHPTMLVNEISSNSLISEAVRGEGAKIINDKGQLIMKGVHPLEDLAPRDIVARQIYNSIQSGEKVYLDISMIPNFRQRFPSITKLCEQNDINIEEGKLPISPGAHFIMGGVKTNLHGETTIPRLYAVGEVAHTGVHGANRLASNSLLEGVVFANKLAKYIIKQPTRVVDFSLPTLIKEDLSLPSLQEIQSVMMKNVGIVRGKEGLLTAKKWFEQFIPFIKAKHVLDIPIEQKIKLNMITVGWLITTSALQRTESRGGHYRNDYPDSNDKLWLKRCIIRRRNENESYQTENAFTTIV
ncbi:L-aspartate oxidase [Vulcanibacillus modesticaldus]|uniref:L-aspartate oxidase n=1 Tax=Vulcanibacillus modesticaldus TaxID=337097 RepID=A0A1D2YWJ4_9BACI|nr:L-aspartate oxidase [Vulcanibacillus modesticaldus]